MGGFFYELGVTPIFADFGLYVYFMDSNIAGKAIVILLAVFSLVAWTIMLGKYADLKEFAKLNKLTERRIAGAASVFEAVATERAMKGPYASLVKEAVKAWSNVDSDSMSSEMLVVRMGHAENAIARTVANQSMMYESKMVLLGSIISGAPFLGLLGTVWGVMDSFGALSTQTSATLQALAPGVSGALLTTVAALVVAIPSIFGYNFLLTLSRRMVLDLENYASSLADRMELESRERYTMRSAEKYMSVTAQNESAAIPNSEAPRIVFNPDEFEQ